MILPEHRADFHEARPWWEAARLSDMYAHRDSIASIIDVGSEEGDFTALYASWGWEVAFIDPSKPWIVQTIDTLAENDLPMGPSFIGFAASFDKLGGTVVEEPRFGDQFTEDEIARITLTTFCELTGFFPDAVTVDVEGGELFVLEGAGPLLYSNLTWWVSVHDCDPHAPVPSTVHAFMREHEYQDQWLGSQHEHWYRFYR